MFRIRNFRFHFFSREEKRPHVHVTSPDGEAKFWLEPEVALADSAGLSQKQINEIDQIVKERLDEIKAAWKEHFGN